jgi:hypothetical protein
MWWYSLLIKRIINSRQSRSLREKGEESGGSYEEDGRAAEGKTFGMLGFFILTRLRKGVFNIYKTFTIEQMLQSKGDGFFAISPQNCVTGNNYGVRVYCP